MFKWRNFWFIHMKIEGYYGGYYFNTTKIARRANLLFDSALEE